MSAKKKNSLLNMTTSLVIISAVAAFILAEIYAVTLEPIKKTKELKTQLALKDVLPEFDRTETKKIKSYDSDDSLTIYVAYKGEDTAGVAIETYTNDGFSGFFSFMIGFTPDGKIVDTKVLEHKETPGLGDKMSKDKFKNQFKGKHPDSYKLKVKKDMGDVDAITASTITSRAFCDGIERAFFSWKGVKK